MDLREDHVDEPDPTNPNADEEPNKGPLALLGVRTTNEHAIIALEDAELIPGDSRRISLPLSSVKFLVAELNTLQREKQQYKADTHKHAKWTQGLHERIATGGNQALVSLSGGKPKQARPPKPNRRSAANRDSESRGRKYAPYNYSSSGSGSDTRDGQLPFPFRRGPSPTDGYRVPSPPYHPGDDKRQPSRARSETSALGSILGRTSI